MQKLRYTYAFFAVEKSGKQSGDWTALFEMQSVVVFEEKNVKTMETVHLPSYEKWQGLSFRISDTEYLRDKVASAAKDHKDTLFAICNQTTFQGEVERFGFNNDPKYDIHVGILGKDGEYYPRWDTTHMSAKMISEFVNQYKAGTYIGSNSAAV